MRDTRHVAAPRQPTGQAKTRKRHGQALTKVLELTDDVRVLAPAATATITSERREGAAWHAKRMSQALLAASEQLTAPEADPALVLLIERVREALVGHRFGEERAARMYVLQAVEHAVSLLHPRGLVPQTATPDALVTLVSQASFATACPHRAQWLDAPQWAELVNAWRIGRGRPKKTARRPTNVALRGEPSPKWTQLAKILSSNEKRSGLRAIKYETLEADWNEWKKASGSLFQP